MKIKMRGTAKKIIITLIIVIIWQRYLIKKKRKLDFCAEQNVEMDNLDNRSEESGNTQLEKETMCDFQEETIGKKCVICGCIINEDNESEEHIIHNAIGGVLKSKAIYCKKCNSEYGSDVDKAFCENFAQIIDGLDMNFDRKAGETSYEGVMCDKKGNLYKTRFKKGKVISMFDSSGKYTKWEKGKYERIPNNFKWDKKAFENGMVKIAFNFAVYSGIDIKYLNKVFDNQKKILFNNPVIIPFMPLTLFDSLMEEQDTYNLYHAMQLFNYKKKLYVYIELFSTFQVYVLLSDNYDGQIYKEYCQIINKNNCEKNRNEIMDALKIYDYKDADIIATQYRIDIKQVIEDLKEYHNYDGEDINITFSKIENIAYERKRKSSYIRNYLELLDERYNKINFEKISSEKDRDYKVKFFSEFQYYTDYEKNKVCTKTYKITIKENNVEYSYPELLQEKINENQDSFQKYRDCKIDMMIKHLQYKDN